MFRAGAEMESGVGSKTPKNTNVSSVHSLGSKTISTTRVAQGPLKTFTLTQMPYIHLQTEGGRGRRTQRKKQRLTTGAGCCAITLSTVL